jgi:hypothetical protein
VSLVRILAIDGRGAMTGTWKLLKLLFDRRRPWRKVTYSGAMTERLAEPQADRVQEHYRDEKR